MSGDLDISLLRSAVHSLVDFFDARLPKRRGSCFAIQAAATIVNYFYRFAILPRIDQSGTHVSMWELFTHCPSPDQYVMHPHLHGWVIAAREGSCRILYGLAGAAYEADEEEQAYTTRFIEKLSSLSATVNLHQLINLVEMGDLKDGSVHIHRPSGTYITTLSAPLHARYVQYFAPRLEQDPRMLYHAVVEGRARPSRTIHTSPHQEWSTIAPVFGLLIENPGATILDVGGGNGKFAHVLTKWFPQARLAVVDPGYYSAPLPGAVTNYGAIPLECIDATFDVVYANMTLHHVLHPHKALSRALGSHVSPNGTIVIRDHCAHFTDYPLLLAVHATFSQIGQGDHGEPAADYGVAERVVQSLQHRNFMHAEQVDDFPPGSLPYGGPLSARVWHLTRPTGPVTSAFVLSQYAYLHNVMAFSPDGILSARLARNRGITVAQFHALFTPLAASLVTGEGAQAVFSVNYRRLLSAEPMRLLEAARHHDENVARVRNMPRKIRKLKCETFVVRKFGEVPSFSLRAAQDEALVAVALGELDESYVFKEFVSVAHSLTARGFVEKIATPAGVPLGEAQWKWLPKAISLGVSVAPLPVVSAASAPFISGAELFVEGTRYVAQRNSAGAMGFYDLIHNTRDVDFDY